jgi:hypothetical protein
MEYFNKIGGSVKLCCKRSGKGMGREASTTSSPSGAAASSFRRGMIFLGEGPYYDYCPIYDRDFSF